MVRYRMQENHRMSSQFSKVKVFVASPGDVQSERDQLSKVINELNLTISAIAPEKGIVLDLIKWETHVHPGLGQDAQDVVNQQIGSYDIFVGVMWKRFGTPTTAAESGTEEEFRRAQAVWEKSKSLPVLFYFCQASFAPPKTQGELEQLSKVISFRTELSQKGLVWEYADPNSFADVIRPHLILVLSKMFSGKSSPMETAEQAGRFTPDSDISVVRKQVAELALDYEQTRRTMRSGYDRTRVMTGIASKLRTLALSIYPLLPDLVHSPSAGERLAVVATLQEIPNPGYLTWLANRIGVEKPFIGYHASVALLVAARVLGKSHPGEVRDAIMMARTILNGLIYEDPNQVYTLESAQREIDELQKIDEP
jgi:hypothetical protein